MLSTIWKFDLAYLIKPEFFQTLTVSVLLYGCTFLILMKRIEKKKDRNYTKMLRTVLNKSWKQHPTKQQLYCHLPSISQTIQVRHAGYCCESKDELVSDIHVDTPMLAKQQKTYIHQQRMLSRALTKDDGW